jgi:endonuclease/exonuclease/phosphatase family metal-dependent hydrolase
MGQRLVFLLVGAILAAACTPAQNYTDPKSPRYIGAGVVPLDDDGALRIVTFNIKYARAVDLAIGAFQKSHALQNADIIALEEMDAPGTERIAQALGLSYVYYPAAVHRKGGKDFGNAILVRGSIEEDYKLVLPHKSRVFRMQRAAVVATVRVAGLRLRVYSVHLEAPGDLWPSQRHDQVNAIIRDAEGFAGPVIVAGDFNNRDRIGRAFRRAGFTWVSERLGHTISFFGWDHIFARGLPERGWRSGIAPGNGASDHSPVWAELPIAPAAGAPAATSHGGG